MDQNGNDKDPGYVILEDLDNIEKRRDSEKSKTSLRYLFFPGKEGDVLLWRKLFSFARPYVPKIVFCILLSLIIGAATGGQLWFVKEGLKPLVDPKEVAKEVEGETSLLDSLRITEALDKGLKKVKDFFGVETEEIPEEEADKKRTSQERLVINAAWLIENIINPVKYENKYGTETREGDEEKDDNEEDSSEKGTLKDLGKKLDSKIKEMREKPQPMAIALWFVSEVFRYSPDPDKYDTRLEGEPSLFDWLFTINSTLSGQVSQLSDAKKSHVKNRLVILVMIFFIIVLIQQFATYFQSVMIRSAGHKIVMDIRNSLFARIMSFSLKFHSKNHSGKLISRLTSDLGVFGSFSTHSAVGAVKDMTILLACLGWLIVESLDGSLLRAASRS